MRIVPLPEAWSLRACVLAEVENPRAWFSAEELAVVDAFAREKRREEWMHSRIAEKELRARGARGEHVSYSHRGPYGAAAVGEEPIGIDVEIARDIRPDSARFFLTADEAADAERCAIPHALLHFWCAKEAAWKQRGGALPTLKRVPLRLLGETDRGLLFDVVETYASGDVVVALAPSGRAEARPTLGPRVRSA
jgi:phosphopantetheinyl transferase (holo-ACP synthase)